MPSLVVCRCCWLCLLVLCLLLTAQVAIWLRAYVLFRYWLSFRAGIGCCCLLSLAFDVIGRLLLIVAACLCCCRLLFMKVVRCLRCSIIVFLAAVGRLFLAIAARCLIFPAVMRFQSLLLVAEICCRRWLSLAAAADGF